jgi:hypothetical protein
MFGEIDDLANAGALNEQVTAGPTLFWNPDVEQNDKEVAGDNDRKDLKSEEPKPSQAAFSMNVGYQFGLTDATSDGALKYQVSLSF